MTTTAGFCACGCGGRTALASKNDRSTNRVKGQPMQFILNHHRRKSHLEYREIDMGNGTPCWVWQRAIGTDGYGGTVDSESGRAKSAHRHYYEKFVGPIPLGMVVDHICRVRACVNPEHLQIVSNAENVRRGKAASLTWSTVRAIRKSDGTDAEIAALFGTSRRNVNAIRNGQTWVEAGAAEGQAAA